MTNDPSRPSSPTPDWVRRGKGIGPVVRWRFTAEACLTGLSLAAETGEVLATDEIGSIYRIDRSGEYSAVTRLRDPIQHVAFSDDGQFVAALAAETQVHRFNRQLQTVWRLDLPERCLQVAIDPYGQYIAVSLADGGNLVFDAQKRRVAGFATIRPLKHLKFLTGRAALLAAAEHGLVCCHSLSGESQWEEKLWSNVGQLAATGDGELVYIAGFNHGIQAFDGSGAPQGSYIVEGTVNRVATSYEPNRLIASTVERHLYWLDADGELLWATVAPEDVAHVACDPFGEWGLCGLIGGEVICLDWTRHS
ncbi:MAG: hypothetical protein KF861_03035 [Planctomycetaceae bacterium]|nr:hypothetical protein [Planctomycetaceae bacterium]